MSKIKFDCNNPKPPAELGRIVYASGDERSPIKKPPLYNKCRSGKPHKIQRRHPWIIKVYHIVDIIARTI